MSSRTGPVDGRYAASLTRQDWAPKVLRAQQAPPRPHFQGSLATRLADQEDPAELAAELQRREQRHQADADSLKNFRVWVARNGGLKAVAERLRVSKDQVQAWHDNRGLKAGLDRVRRVDPQSGL